MPLHEITVGCAALEWFGQLGYAVEHGTLFASGELAAGQVVERRGPYGQNGRSAMNDPPSAPKGHNEIAQGKANARPGRYAVVLGKLHIDLRAAWFRPFRAWVVSGTPIPGRRFALPWAIPLRPVGA